MRSLCFLHAFACRVLLVPSVIGVVLAATSGCTTYTSHVREAHRAFYAGDLPAASAALDEIGDRRPGDRDIIELDRAIIELVGGRPGSAESRLRTVRDRFDFLEQQSMAEEGLALISDDTRRAYAGEDYEKVLIRAFLAISNLMGDGEDALAYCLQVDEKQRELIGQGLRGADQNPKLAYQPVAIGPYLHGVLREASHSSYDDAERAYAAVASWEPEFQLARVDLARAQAGVHSARGHGVVIVIALVGRGPYKEETTAPATSAALLIADRLVTASSDHSLPPTIAPVKVPQIAIPINSVSDVEVLVGGQPSGRTETITNIGRLATLQYEATRDHVVARAVARRVLKKSAVYGVKSALNVDSAWTELALDAAGVVWEATENADTRSWGLLPETIQVARVELPFGSHELSLRPLHRGRRVGPGSSRTVHVDDGRNTYVLAYFPTERIVGEILTSGERH